jgi:hypothetical protein
MLELLAGAGLVAAPLTERFDCFGGSTGGDGRGASLLSKPKISRVSIWRGRLRRHHERRRIAAHPGPGNVLPRRVDPCARSTC